MRIAEITLRPFQDSDYEGYAAILAQLRPDPTVPADQLRRWDRDAACPPLSFLQLSAETTNDGELVGVGSIQQHPTTYHPQKFMVMIFVRRDRQRLGIGSQLLAALERVATDRRASTFRAVAYEDETQGISFLTRWGFRERDRSWQSFLDIASADPNRLTPYRARLRESGIEITTLSAEGIDRPDVVERLRQLFNDTGVDMPRGDPFTPWTTELFRRAMLEGPEVLPDGWFLAKSGDRYLGVSQVVRIGSSPDTLFQGYTCARREVRGMKIALALKLEIIEYARRCGYARLRTNNSSLNAPMLKLNDGLGFRRARAMITFEKALTG